MSDSKNNLAWIELFSKYDILKQVSSADYAIISAETMIEFREPRLLAKIDHRAQLPKIFSDNNLSILPVARGHYIISNFQTFHDFDKNEVEITRVDFPTYLESLDYKNITSEATAINCAYVCGILQDFIEEDLLPTVSGKMSSSSFDFYISKGNSKFKVGVQNSQLEVDGGYEGLQTLNLIEAKNYISDDFLIRQLFYPFKLWAKKITKRVRPIFLTYTNGIFHLREYTFDDINYYNSLRLLRQKRYAIREEAINAETIQNLLKRVRTISEPNIPFPQADSFERVINLCELLNDKTELSKEEITENYDFDERQTNYYTSAGMYLGLIEKASRNRQPLYLLTTKCKFLFKLAIVNRQREFVKLILSHTPFKKTLELYFEKSGPPSKEEIVEIMKDSNLYEVHSENTFQRRASTILGWINWIMGLIEE